MSIEAFETSIRELIEDKESNEMIEYAIYKYLGNTYDMINNPQFHYVLLKYLIAECLLPQESVNRWILDQNQLRQRCELIQKYIHNYIEYQLSLILVLASIKTELGFNESLFDKLITSLYSFGVISSEAFNHWFKCNAHFQKRVNVIDCCARLLNWIQESREDYFFETHYIDS